MSENKHFSLKVKKRSLILALDSVAEKVVTGVERIRQKKDKIIASVPLLNKIDARIKKFDADMTQKHGQVYTKIRDSLKNTARTVAVYQLFGIPGVVGLCAYKTGEKAFSLLRPACQAKKNGEVDSLLDYFKKNKKECQFTLTSASLSIASAAATVAGVRAVSDVVRVGKASLLAVPELKNTIKSTKDWITGKQSFEEVKRDAAVLGITVATYFAGPAGVPMTRGAGKPLEEADPAKEEQKRVNSIQQKAENRKRREEFFDMFVQMNISNIR